jgi:small subunit ribosomal protein S2
MAVDTKVIRELLENGVHFGHQTNKWNPKMKEYIFGEKSGIYIIDLKKTEEALTDAVNFLSGLAAAGKKILFVGTKKQAKSIISDEAQRCGMFYVNERWLGGTLTNFTTIRKSVQRLHYIEGMKKSDIYGSLAKKEKAHLEKEELKLLKNLRGIKDMEQLPSALIVVDEDLEKTAIKEAYKVKIPVVGLIDTNCDPDLVDYPIPGNDDAIRSIRYIIAKLAEAVESGRNQFDSGTIKVTEFVAPKEEAPEKAAEAAKVEEPVVEAKVVEEESDEAEGDIKLS